MRTLKYVTIAFLFSTSVSIAQLSYSPMVDSLYAAAVEKISQRQFDAARTEIERILSENAAVRDVQKAGYFLQGFTFVLEKRFAEAITPLRKAAELVESIDRDKKLTARSNIFLAECYNSLDSTANALSHYTRVVESFPDGKEGVEALIRANRVYVSRGLISQARENLDNVISSYSGKKVGLAAANLKAENFIKEKDYQSALPLLQSIARDNAETIDGSWVQLKLGEVYLYGVRDKSRARLAFEGVTKDYPDSDASRLAKEHLAEIADLGNE